MKAKHTNSCLLAITSVFLTPLYAGEPIAEPTAPPLSNEPDAFSWLTPSVDLRTRYEFRDQQGLDASHALTGRARLGLLLGDFGGFSFFGEVEGTGAAIGDYRSNPTGDTSTYPYENGNTPINDPRNAEINQLWVEYKKEGYFAKIGRQRIIRNDAAFIGNVGWRQNEQTYDAAQIGFANEELSLSYAYSNRVQRIFGKESNDALPGPPLRDFEGDFHILDGSYNADFGTIGGYAYLLDIDNNTNVGKSNTYGLFSKIDKLHVEFAFQNGESTIGGNYDALYGHIHYTIPIGKSSLVAGLEYPR